MDSRRLDLEHLQLSAREIERLSGLEVSDRWIGGILGVYRFSRLQTPVDWLGWLLFELVTTALLFVFTVPIGLGMVRLFSAQGGWGANTVMLASMGVFTLIGMLVWNGGMMRQGRSLQTFMHLLDEIDHYHGVLKTVDILEQFQSIHHDQRPRSDSDCFEPLQFFETLQLTRDCLVAGLKTERILRERIELRSHLEEGLSQLEHHLTTLQALDLQNQASEYAKLMTQALKIGQSVRAELVQSYDRGRNL